MADTKIANRVDARTASKFILEIVFGFPIMLVLGVACAGLFGLVLSPFILIAVFLFRVITGV